MFLYRHRNVLTNRHGLDRPFQIVLVEFQPLRHTTAYNSIHGIVDGLDFFTLFPDLDNIPGLGLVGGDIDLPAID